MTLTEFLLARIAEDEAAARHVWPERYTERMLAECEAKRRIVEEHWPDRAEDRCGCCWLGDLEAWEPYPCPTLRFLALPYTDHPDYREEWKP